ncbi:MAG: flagellar biosynthetic protein FliQ [Acidobacteria bacterium]|nr:MAG: flagellar biosynthetic protein FliQ [Acidobacteriota bacterium]
MNEMMVITIGREAMRITLLVGLPMLMAGMLVGIVVSVLQVATSIQDITITFIPKILAVFLALTLSLNWILRLLVGFARQIFDIIATLGA